MTSVTFKKILNQMPGICFVKDKSSKYIWVNQNGLQISKLKLSDMIGQNDDDMPWYHLAEKFKREDKNAMEGNIQHTISIGHSTKGETNTLIMLKKSPYLTENQKIQGSIAIGLELNFENHESYLSSINSHNFRMSDYLSLDLQEKKEFIYKSIKFSKRQAQILGYILRGHSAISIAQLLKLSKRTVEYYIDNIKDKLQCDKKSEIIEKAFNIGFIDLMFLKII